MESLVKPYYGKGNDNHLDNLFKYESEEDKSVKYLLLGGLISSDTIIDLETANTCFRMLRDIKIYLITKTEEEILKYFDNMDEYRLFLGLVDNSISIVENDIQYYSKGGDK